MRFKISGSREEIAFSDKICGRTCIIIFTVFVDYRILYPYVQVYTNVSSATILRAASLANPAFYLLRFLIPGLVSRTLKTYVSQFCLGHVKTTSQTNPLVSFPSAFVPCYALFYNIIILTQPLYFLDRILDFLERKVSVYTISALIRDVIDRKL